MSLTGCGGQTASVAGTVTYLVRMALPPEAVINVQLRDVSKMDVASELIAETTFEAEGSQVPFPFTIAYDPDVIVESNTYSLSATITLDGQVIFRTTQAYPVITQDNPTKDIELVLEPMG
jgi:putative lipoprotein